MGLFILGACLLVSSLGQTTALVLFGREGFDQNGTRASLNERAEIGAAVLPTMLRTIYLSGDARRPRTADLGFDFRIESGLWALCPTTVENAIDCMVGSCIDNFLCSKGCGFTDMTTLPTVRCTASGQFCSTAFLTPQTAAPDVTNYACAGDVDEEYYKGFTTLFVEAAETTTAATTRAKSTSTTTSTSARSTSSVSSPTSASSEPVSTPAPASSNARGGNESSSSSSTPGPATDSSTQSNSGGVANNMGPIIGGVVGCVALLCGFGLAVVWLLRRNKNTNTNDKASSEPSSSLDEADRARRDEKPELEARERLELYGRSLSEMSARGPAAYDTALYRPNYPPMTPVELPVRASWK